MTARMLLHNCVAHPLAGLLWLVGLAAWGDWVHDVTAPLYVPEPFCASCQSGRDG